MKKPKAERVRYIGLVNLRPEGMSIEEYTAWIDSPEMEALRKKRGWKRIKRGDCTAKPVNDYVN